MRPIAILFSAVVLLVACARKVPPVTFGGQPINVADYSNAEVEALRASIAKLTFPVPRQTIAKMLPRPVERLPVEFVDWMPDREKKGRIGGNVAEYWLNEDRVLKVATAHYSRGEEHFSLEEWAVILTRAEREGYSREVY